MKTEKPYFNTWKLKYFMNVMKNTSKNPLKGFNERKNLMESENFYKSEVPQKQGTQHRFLRCIVYKV